MAQQSRGGENQSQAWRSRFSRGSGSQGNWDEDESRYGGGRGTREGSDYGSRGFSSQSRGQSWGDRDYSGIDDGSDRSADRELEGVGYSGGRMEFGDRDSFAAAQGQSFRGRGPKGYQRSDERIKEIVCDQLSDDPLIDASEISVAVANGIVTLSGAVNDRGTQVRGAWAFVRMDARAPSPPSVVRRHAGPCTGPRVS